MKLTPGLWAIAILNAIYILGFGAFFILQGNMEFAWYVLVMVGVYLLLALTIKRSKFPLWLLWALSLWGLLHMLGGGLRIDDHVLYAQQLFHLIGAGETYILKYDQVVHFYGFGVATIVLYHLLRPYLAPTTKWSVVNAILVASGMGLGALNEIVEFMAVIFSGRNGVGGYFNTAIDLVFNMLGAIVAIIIMNYLRKRELIRKP
jgi:uncharacterized membrane protein YjdF